MAHYIVTLAKGTAPARKEALRAEVETWLREGGVLVLGEGEWVQRFDAGPSTTTANIAVSDPAAIAKLAVAQIAESVGERR